MGSEERLLPAKWRTSSPARWKLRDVIESEFLFLSFLVWDNSFIRRSEARFLIFERFWKAGRSHTGIQHVFLLASHLTFGPESKWLPPTLADWGVNLTNLEGHRRLLLPSPSTSSTSPSEAFVWGGNGEPRHFLLCCNHLLQRLFCFSVYPVAVGKKMKLLSSLHQQLHIRTRRDGYLPSPSLS